MKHKALLMGAVACIALAGTADAAHFHAWYVGLEAGASWIDDTDAVIAVSGEISLPPIPGTIEFDSGWAVFATAGYAFDNHWRLEGELGYRANDTTSGIADVTEWSIMLNALYDIPISEKLDLSLGAGVGYDQATLDFGGADEFDGNIAYQGIVGLNYALGSRTDLTLTYRYLVVEEPNFAFAVPGGAFTVDADNVNKHAVTIGLRYDLYPDEAPMAAAPPPPPPPPPPVVPSHFVVFFDFAKCNITAQAEGILSDAAAAAKSKGSASIQIVGHTDTVGSNKANQRLSECRANAAKSNLVAKGIPAGAIATSGHGESELFVKTGDDVKELQNRRAEIDLN